MEIQTQISYENNQKYLNKQIDVLIEGMQKGNSSTLIGRGKFQAPEVDGIIFVDPVLQMNEVINTIQKVDELFNTANSLQEAADFFLKPEKPEDVKPREPKRSNEIRQPRKSLLEIIKGLFSFLPWFRFTLRQYNSYEFRPLG